MIELYDHQKELISRVSKVLRDNKIAILNADPRTGKTHVGLAIAKNYSNVLFLTKKKAIQSIEDDYAIAEHTFSITIINYESVHKVEGVFDLVICDESHVLAGYPKLKPRIKAVGKLVTNDLLLMTATLVPESNAQIYHQLWISPYSPYRKFENFYHWHKKYGTPRWRKLPHATVADYSVVSFDRITPVLDVLNVTYTQEKAGFTTKVTEHILNVDMKPETVRLMNLLRRKLVIHGQKGDIVADTKVKLRSKLQQMSSGTVKLENGLAVTLDTTKVEFVKKRFKGKRIAIFYFYKQEYAMIKDVFGDTITNDLQKFHAGDKHIALQQISGAEGINLSAADVLVFIDFGFSNVKYIQAKDRLTTMTRKVNDVYFIISNNGIDGKVYNALQKKRDYVIQTFKHDERARLSKKNQ